MYIHMRNGILSLHEICLILTVLLHEHKSIEEAGEKGIQIMPVSFWCYLDSF